MNKHFLEKCQIAAGVVPVNLASGANSGDWFDMSKYGRCAIVFVAGIGTTANDATITLQQAETDGGTPAALNFDRIDVKQGAALSAIGQFTQLENADADYVHADNAEEQFIYVIDVKAEDLIEGYRWIRANVNQVGQAKIGTVLYIGHEPRYGTVPLPSAID